VDPDSKRLSVFVSDGRGRPVRDGGLSRWLAAAAPARARGEVAVALVTDAHIRKLNSQYRRKPLPTDVLSFPAQSRIPHPGSRIPDRIANREPPIANLVSDHR